VLSAGSAAKPGAHLGLDLLGARLGAGSAQPEQLHPLADFIQFEGGAEASCHVIHEIKYSRSPLHALQLLSIR